MYVTREVLCLASNAANLIKRQPRHVTRTKAPQPKAEGESRHVLKRFSLDETIAYTSDFMINGTSTRAYF